MNETAELDQGNNTKWMDLENLLSRIYIVKISINGKDLIKKKDEILRNNEAISFIL
jgi:hypothetical protein